jgi:hypothetical protein
MHMSRFLSVLVALGVASIPAVVWAQAVNFHDASNGAFWNTSINNWQDKVYVGQGAYVDPGNNTWNGFGMPSGFPGDALTASTGPNKTSSGGATPITLDTTYGFDNGAIGYNSPNAGDNNTAQGQPSFILGEAAVVNGANPTGSFTLHHVPAGTYNLYLYGANFDNDRGAVFSVASGAPLGGVTTTMNTKTGSPANAFVPGATYVEWLNVTPNASGDIAGTWGAVSNTITGQTGEGDFNGLQLVAVPEPTTLAVLGLPLAGMLIRRRRAR